MLYINVRDELSCTYMSQNAKAPCRYAVCFIYKSVVLSMTLNCSLNS